MAKFSDIEALVKKYGTTDVELAIEGTATDVVLRWNNEGIELMRKQIVNNSRVKGRSTLAQSFTPVVDGNSIKVLTTEEYAGVYDYIDKGVKGLTKNKAPRSPYKFKNLGTPQAMIDSFKKWSATAGITNVKNNTLSFKGKKRQTALSDQQSAAKQLAVMTKLGGIKPKNFISRAINRKRIQELSNDLSVALGKTITFQIIQK